MSPFAIIPNPALPAPQPSLNQSFPWNTRPTHHMHATNDNVRGGYYTTRFDDPHHSTYQAYQVKLLEPQQRQERETQEQNGTPQDDAEVKLSSSLSGGEGTHATARSLGFGRRHESYKEYVHHTQPQIPAPVSSAQSNGCVLLPLPTHLSGSSSSEALHGADVDPSRSLVVPFYLARSVPMDSRDGDGKRGHHNAASLGYGPSHRNFYKYLQDNREGNEELAYFRSKHVS